MLVIYGVSKSITVSVSISWSLLVNANTTPLSIVYVRKLSAPHPV
jgi:hypothetical protein